ncbi:MAG: hypothetical protein WC367_00345 [Methanoregula sp.]
MLKTGAGTGSGNKGKNSDDTGDVALRKHLTQNVKYRLRGALKQEGTCRNNKKQPEKDRNENPDGILCRTLHLQFRGSFDWDGRRCPLNRAALCRLRDQEKQTKKEMIKKKNRKGTTIMFPLACPE